MHTDCLVYIPPISNKFCGGWLDFTRIYKDFNIALASSLTTPVVDGELPYYRPVSTLIIPGFPPVYTMSTALKDVLIIITDSRGTGIDNLIKSNELEDDFKIVTRVIRGCDLPRAVAIARSLMQSYSHRNYYCILFVGICSLTEKGKSRSIRSIHYPIVTRDTKLECIIQVLGNLKAEFGDRINVPTIIPASLEKFFTYSNPDRPVPKDLQEEQFLLLDDIKTINQGIKETNAKSSTTSTINLAGRFYSHSIKKNRKTKSGAKRRVEKFCDTQLFDGLHLTDHIKSTCFALIFESAKRDLGRLKSTLKQSPSRTSSEDSGSESEWDFKRKAVTDALHS